MITQNTFHFEFAVGTAPQTTGKDLTLADIAAMLQNYGNKKDESSYLPGEIKDHYRKNVNIISRSVVTLDLDGVQEGGFDALCEYLSEYTYLWHTTYSHCPDKPSYRFLVPLSRPVSAGSYADLVRQIIVDNPKASIDPASAKPAQIMFTPAADYAGLFYEWGQHDGVLADANSMLAAANGGEAVVPLMRTDKKAEPTEAPGIVGRFNRVFPTLDSLIAPAGEGGYGLPYAYDAATGRYRYTKSSGRSAPGMREIEERPGLFYSWHGNDPASGFAQNSFDLLRIHKFGHLDAEYVGPVNRAPSYEACREFLNSDENFKNREAQGRFSEVLERMAVASQGVDPGKVTLSETPQQPALNDAVDAPVAEATAADNTSWADRLTWDAKTSQVENTVHNLDLIFANDPKLRGLAWNDRGGYEAWMPEDYSPLDGAPKQLNNIDIAVIQTHIERIYNIRNIPKARIEQILSDRMDRFHFDPVQDYLNGLEWDGTPRLETCLPGVEDNEYTRMASRKALVGAVARALSPGCKVDQSLILYGEAGLGKTWWIERMSRGFNVPLGPVHRKDTLIVASRSWIVVSDEGHALSRAEFNQLKEFMTQTHDTYRPPYERTAITTPRRWVIWGTTNDPYMLREREGNRRFLMVDCSERADFDRYTDEYVDQVWAEAVHLWRNGESPVLSQVEEIAAEEARKAHTQEDALASVISEAIEAEVPVEWDTMPVPARQQALGQMDAGISVGETRRRTHITPPEVWTEILRRPLSEFNLMEQRRVLDVLINLARKGIVERERRQRKVPIHGVQPVFRIPRYEVIKTAL